MFSLFNKKNKTKDRISSDPELFVPVKDLFPDEAFADLIVQNLGLKNKKEKVSLKELDRIMNLEAKNRGIRSLEGLEFLNNLVIADFSNNQIEELPDYSEGLPNLYKNKNTLLYMNLENNPFLDQSTLFSMESTENRRTFFNQFEDPELRFGLGEVKERVYPEIEPNPILVQKFIEKVVSSGSPEERRKKINDLLLRYIIGKKVFYNKDVYKNDYILDRGELRLKRAPLSYLNAVNEIALPGLIETLLPEEDRYLIRSLLKENNTVNPELSTMTEMVEYYRSRPEELTKAYHKTNNTFVALEDYQAVKDSSVSGEEEARLTAINDEAIRNLYLKYLEYANILKEYAKDKNNREVEKYLVKSNDFIDNFLNQYIELQNNQLLSDLQKARVSEAGPALEKFVNNFTEEARSFFDQDIFGLQVEMKYIDMLSEANKRFS